MATYDNNSFLTLDTVMNTIITNNLFSYYYVLGILNSKLAEWYYYWFVYNRAIRTMHFDAYYLGKLPIKIPSDKNKSIKDKIEALVSKIVMIKNQDCLVDTSHLEAQVDQLVYELYELTPEEIELIEGKVKL